MATVPTKTPYNRSEDRRKMRRQMLSALFLGMVRGIGMAIGFSGLAVALIFVVKIIPLDKIPVLGEIITALIEGQR